MNLGVGRERIGIDLVGESLMDGVWPTPDPRNPGTPPLSPHPPRSPDPNQGVALVLQIKWSLGHSPILVCRTGSTWSKIQDLFTRYFA